jgi:hypothetical protein
VALAGTAIVGAVAFRDIVIAIFNCRTRMPGDAGHFHFTQFATYQDLSGRNRRADSPVIA